MKTIKQCSGLLLSGSGMSIREAYETPKSEIFVVNPSSPLLVSGGGETPPIHDQGEDEYMYENEYDYE